MRSRLITCLERVMQNPKVVLLLGDVGAYSFRNLNQRRVFNFDVSEQAIIGMAAGLALEGYLPVVFTIAPFIVERALEQIKIDICSQGLKVILVSVGASYDYAGEGLTHHCPGDVGILLNVPNMNIFVPGTADEFEKLFCEIVEERERVHEGAYYFRLSKKVNRSTLDTGAYFMQFLDPHPSDDLIVLSIGPTLDLVLDSGIPNRHILYATHVYHYQLNVNKLLIVEPYYPALATDMTTYTYTPMQILSVGVRKQFHHVYTTKELDEISGLTVDNIQMAYKRLGGMLNAHD